MTLNTRLRTRYDTLVMECQLLSLVLVLLNWQSTRHGQPVFTGQ